VTDDLQVVTLTDPDRVTVPQPDITVLTAEVATPVIIESPQIDVVVIDEDIHVVDEVREIHVVTVGEQGPPGGAGAKGDKGDTGDVGAAGAGGMETYVAGATISGHTVVVTDAIGQAIPADVTNAAHAPMAMKLALNGANIGNPVSVQLVGRVTEPTWAWIAEAILYVGTAGQLTPTVPAPPSVFSRAVAVAETPTTILLVQESPLMLA
jgi:hypothetical protein